MAFTDEQMRAIEAQGKVIVSASAGSGKTTVMIEKIIRQIILSGVGVDEILAVTFTKKAAAQMKEKLSKTLIAVINVPTIEPEKRENLKKQLAKVPTADISTIHSYCARLIRSHFFAAGVDSGFKVIGGDDADGRALKGQALDELLDEGYESQDEEFAHLLSSYWRKKKDNGLRRLLLATYTSLRDRADYREYLERVKKGYDEEAFEGACTELLVLFQEKCKYYYELVEDENAYFMDLPGSEKQLALCKELMDWLEGYLLANDYFEAAAIEKPSFTRKSVTKKDSDEKRAHIERLAFLKERIVGARDWEFGKLSDKQAEKEKLFSSGKTAAAIAKYLLRFDEKYEEKKRERGVLDYNDLEHKALALLKEEEIAKETQEKYRCVFVDEYQDVNPVQEEIISRLSKDNLFLVGDVKQSIYGFRGSKSSYFVETQGRFERSGHSLYMSNNFRSADKVLDAVNAQFSLAMTPRVCAVDYARDGVMKKGGRYALNSGKVCVYLVGKEEKAPPQGRGVYSVKEHAEGRQIPTSRMTQTIAEIIQSELCGYLTDPSTGEKRPVRYADIAILSRKKSGEIEDEIAALTELGLPVTTASAVNVCEFSEVKALIDILSLLDNAEQDIPLCSALLSGMGGLTADDLAEIRLAYRGTKNFRTACRLYAEQRKTPLAEKLNAFYGYFGKLRTESCLMTAGEVLVKILADTQMEAGLLARRSGAVCLKRIRRFIEEASAFGGDGVHEFLAHLRNLDYKIEYSENGGEDSIQMMTMHASKGLEFPIVILPNLNQSFSSGETPEVYVEEKYGLAPRAFDPEKMLRHPTVLRKLCEVKEERSSLADELNLYYVAMTRAEHTLHLLFNEVPPMPDVKYAKSFAEFTDFSVWEEYMAEPLFFGVKKQERETLLQGADEGRVEEIVRAYRWQYPHGGYENLPVKSSPTALMEGGKFIPKRRFAEFGKEEEDDELVAEEVRSLVVREGTAYHAFLERFDFSRLLVEGERVDKRTLEALVEEALAALPEREVETALLEKNKLTEILSNEVFYGLQGMRLYKEQQFLVSLPVKDTYARKEGVDPILLEKEGEEMIFQGAIDLLAVGEETRIIDYKYSRQGAEALKEHYRPQLNLYRLAVAKIMNIPPESIRCSIVNIRKGFQVDMD